MGMVMMFDEATPRSRVAVLLKEFSRIDDDREPWRVAFPLAEVLLLLTCATVAECDDFDAIAAWGLRGQHINCRNLCVRPRWERLIRSVD